MDQRWARPWFALTALAVAAGIVIQLFVTADAHGGHFPTTWERVLNVFAFFTIQSNVIVGVTTLLLALDLGRTSTAFRVLRLTGVVAISVTFLVFHVALSRLLDLETWAQAANQLQHTVVPVMAVVGWCTFGPRQLASARVAKLTVVFPLAYMLFTVVRGPLASDWYPYPFADVDALGYVRVAVNAVWIALLFVGIAAGATTLDKKLASGDEADRSTTSA
jgi:hypothetical protein